ncbi:MAG: hypothetical protein K8U57_29155 [Planctomycetes bacterium]|nr:hypothetical protein [Planctomycetota bacterium]
MGCDIHAAIEYRHPNGFYASFTDGGLLVYRDYELFGALAGVRGDPDKPPLVEPRGLPPEFGTEVSSLYFERELVEGTWRVTPCPDWHSASWLTATEVRAALAHYGRRLEECGPEFRAAVAAMDELDRCIGQGASRLVFWFDN